MNRLIHIIGDITEESFKDFCLELADLESDSSEPININMLSRGGDPAVALGFYERIRQSPCTITITAYGIIASAAVLVLAAAAKRKMTRSSWVLVHTDISFVTKHDRVPQAEKALKENLMMEAQWNRLLEYTTATIDLTWDKLHKEETYLDANKCLELGLVDEVI